MRRENRGVEKDVEITMIVRVVLETKAADFVTRHVHVWTELTRADLIWVRVLVVGITSLVENSVLP